MPHLNKFFGIKLFIVYSMHSFGSQNLERVEQVCLASLIYELKSGNEKHMMTVYKNKTPEANETHEETTERHS